MFDSLNTSTEIIIDSSLYENLTIDQINTPLANIHFDYISDHDHCKQDTENNFVDKD